MSFDRQIFERLFVEDINQPLCTGGQWFGENASSLSSQSPVDGSSIASTGLASAADYEKLLTSAAHGFSQWRNWPAPKRGDVVRQYAQELRRAKEDLGHLVSFEMGKSLQEGLGEVQEMIDICDFAVGLSRQLYGKTMHSERPEHRMYEQWHPVGLVGIISAFNFPVAVWSWNAMIAAVCGNSTVWKPSLKTPISAIACFKLLEKVLKKNQVPEGTFNLMIGEDKDIAEQMTADERFPVISATGSTPMGRKVGAAVAARLGRSILELGGNNAIILSPHADFNVAIPGIVFGAVGTCGQRCTSTRRLIVHDSIYVKTKSVLLKAYHGLKIGNPLDSQNHVGPLIDTQAVEQMQSALQTAVSQGGQILFGGNILKDSPSECYVRPALVEIDSAAAIVGEETFAPILYLTKYSGGVENAILIQNSVRQGLSSSIFTNDFRESETFLSINGSDCGIANVNIGTSGAEIGGAFGGEKDTGGGRESGSDSWKGYMRRQTNTLNYGTSLPLAQGIEFDL